MDFAAVVDDRRGEIGEHGVEETEEARTAEALGGRGRGAQIEKQERPLLDLGRVIAPGDEGDEDVDPEQVGDADKDAEDEACGQGEGDVLRLADPRDREAVEQGHEDRVDENGDDKQQRRARAKRDQKGKPPQKGLRPFAEHDESTHGIAAPLKKPITAPVTKSLCAI